MNATRKINSIRIQISDLDAYDIIEAIEMAENEGVYNKASTLKTILEALLRHTIKGDIE